MLTQRSSRRKGFTLVELLVTITIIAILTTVSAVVFSRTLAKARDGRRRADLKDLQTALELYYSENQAYPSTSGAWWGQCSNYGGHTDTCSGDVFIPGLCPTYINNIPIDPKADASGGDCYLYRSDGTDYSVLAHQTMETVGADPGPDDPMDRVCCPQPTIAVYSAGGRNW